METTEKTYELRALVARDIFSLARILGKINFADIKAVWTVSDEDKEKLADPDLTEEGRAEIIADINRNAGLSVAWAIVQNLPLCEKEVYGFIGSMINKKSAEVENMDPGEFIGCIVDIAQMEQFRDFLQRASALIK